MNINGSHVQGIFKYNSSLEYEKGDFVIDSDVLYICTAESPTSSINQTVSGQQPSLHPENFKVYLGDRISSVSEYLKYIDSPENSEDKYVSSHSLSGILNHYMFGLDERGIIKEYVKYSSDSGIEITQGLGDLLLNGSSPEGILGDILRSPELNNALIMISSSLPEIYTLDGSPESDYIQLRQTTYSSTGGNVRIQEIINPVKGKVWWRVTSPGNWSSVTSWKSSFYSDQVKKDLDALHNYYQQKLQDIEVIKLGLKKVWRYESVELSSNRSASIVLNCESPTPPDSLNNYGYVPVPPGSFKIYTDNFSAYQSLGDRLVLQICLRVGSNHINFRSASITIDLIDSLLSTTNGTQISSYNVAGLATLNVSQENNNRVRISATPLEGYTNPIIYNIFYRKYYE